MFLPLDCFETHWPLAIDQQMSVSAIVVIALLQDKQTLCGLNLSHTLDNIIYV